MQVEDPAAKHCSKEGLHYHLGANRKESCHETCDKCHMAWVRWKSRCRCEVFVVRKARTITLEQSARMLSEDKQQSTYSRVWISFGDSILGVLHSLTNARKCQLEDFVRKKGMNHVQSNGCSQQMPSAKFGKEKTYQWWSYYQVPMSVLLWETHAFCSRDMGAHVRYTSAKKLVSSDFVKILEVATKLRETYEKTLFTPPSPTKATNSIVSV